MAQIVVRHLEEEVKDRLWRRAAQHGRSMEEEVGEILRNAVKDDEAAISGLGPRIAARFVRRGLTDDLPELRGQGLRPARWA